VADISDSRIKIQITIIITDINDSLLKREADDLLKSIKVQPVD
jgi:hypothetical protein